MKRATFVSLVAVLLAAWACRPLGAAEPPAADTEAARRTAEKLGRSGVVDGVDWSVKASFAETPLPQVLDWLVEKARGKPWEVKIVVDHDSVLGPRMGPESPAAPGDFGSPGDLEMPPVRRERKVTLNLPGVSLGDALGLILPERVSYRIQEDGSLLITREELHGYISGVWPLGPDLPTRAAAETRRKLVRTGTVEGRRWSVDLEVTATPRSQVLDLLCRMAATEPRDIKILVNTPLIADAFGGKYLDKPVTVHAKDVSLQQALALALGAELAYVIQEDGTVFVAPRRSLQKRGASARADFRLSWNPNMRTMDETWRAQRTYDSALRGPEVLGRAMQEILGVSPERASDYCGLSVRLIHGVPGHLGLDLRLFVGGRGGSPEIRPVARQVLEAMVPHLQSALEAEHEKGLERLRDERGDLDKELQALKVQMAELDKERGALLKALEAAGYQKGVEINYQEKAAQLTREVEDLEMDVEVKQVRRVALAKQVALIQAEAKSQLKEDAIAAELDRVVQGREEQLAGARKLAERGYASRDVILEAEVRLAEAKTRLAERREAVSRQAGGELLGKFNAELAMLSIDLAEAQARRFLLECRRDKAMKIARLQEELRMKMPAEHKLRGGIDRLQREVDKLTESIEKAEPPRVELEVKAD